MFKEGTLLHAVDHEIDDSTFEEIEKAKAKGPVGLITNSRSSHRIKRCIELGVSYFEIVRDYNLSYGIFHGPDVVVTESIFRSLDHYSIPFCVVTHYTPKLTHERLNALADELLKRGAENWKIIYKEQPMPSPSAWGKFKYFRQIYKA